MKLKRTVLAPLLVASVAFVSGGWLLQRGALEGESLVQRARLFEEVLHQISQRHADEHSPADLYRMAVDGLLRELGDPHTSFMTAEQFNQLRVQTTGEYGGLGIEIDQRDSWITVVSVLPETPAERAGLLPGDRIVEVEGESTHNWTSDQAVKVLRGPRGQPVNIRVGRIGVPDPIPFRIVRDEIQINPVETAYMVGDEIGYVKLRIFSEQSASEVRRAIEGLRQEGMSRLVLDMRNNPGGLLDQGIAVSDLFLNRGDAIVETRSRVRAENRTYRGSTPAQYTELSIVVLVNEYSASASEIVAGALQDHDRALVIGSASFGKGSVQSLVPLSGGNFLKLTTGRWYTPVGRSIERPAGHDPDLMALLEGSPALGGDEAPVPQPVDTLERRPYRTASGRTVYGGGGIVPDLIIRADTMTLPEQEFFRAASRGGAAYANALFSFAAEYIQRNPQLRQDFQVTPELRQAFYQRLRAADIDVSTESFMQAERVIDRHLAVEIARQKFGQAVAARRGNEMDNVVQRAFDLLRGATGQAALFRLAETQRAPRS
jgi:carboxyl-terminal processing protease